MPQISFRQLLWSSTLWAAICAGSAVLTLALGGRLFSHETPIISATFLFGGFLAWPVSHAARNWLLGIEPVPTRMAAVRFLLLASCTIALTAFVFALLQRSYYAQWHGDFPSLRWVLTFVFTMVAAGYQFLVLGIRLYFPVAFLALLALIAWDLRRSR